MTKLRLIRLFLCLASFGPVLGGCKEVDSRGSSGGNPPSGGDSTSPVTLAWDAPSQGADGSELTDLAGFKVYESVTPGTYSSVTEVGNSTQHTFDALPEGTHYFSVTAYDIWGNESDFSNEVTAVVSNSAAPEVAALVGH